jgi:hypothetical protein
MNYEARHDRTVLSFACRISDFRYTMWDMKRFPAGAPNVLGSWIFSFKFAVGLQSLIRLLFMVLHMTFFPFPSMKFQNCSVGWETSVSHFGGM